VLGVFIGSAAWWLALVGIVSRFRRLLTPNRRIWINRLSGLILMAFGALAIISVL
jgi:threonine/homoserine/homoserine lactone efflux protein